MRRASSGRVLLSLAAALSGVVLVAGCGSSGDGITPPPSGRVIVVNGNVSGTGTVKYFGFEGGFFAIRGDDQVTYDPLDGLPASVRRDGLRVRFAGRIRNDLMGFHMAGPIVELTSVTPE